MIGPVDFYYILMSPDNIARAHLRYDAMPGSLADGWGWAGFAAEFALMDAINAESEGLVCVEAPTLDYDLKLISPGDGGSERLARIEVKTRVVSDGWIFPERYDWLTIPTHDGREPVKPAADLIVFCWYSGSETYRLWVLGYLRGVAEFRERTVFYRENEPLPRGGWAPKGGAYCIEVKNLRPLPRGLLKEPS